MPDEPTVRNNTARKPVDFRTVRACDRCGAWHQYTDQKKHAAMHDQLDRIERMLAPELTFDPNDQPPPF